MNLRKLNKLGIVAVIITGVCLLALGGAVMARMQGEDLPEGALASFAARRGPLPITVNVTGSIASQDVVVVKCDVQTRGGVAVLWLIDQGTVVEEGDLLLQLDGSEFEDNAVDQEIQVQNANASLITAVEELAVTKNQAQSDMDAAQLEFDLAKLDLQKFVEGDYPAQIKEADAQVTLALGDLSRAENTLRGSERLAEKDFITSDELEGDRLSALRAQLNVQLAEEAKMVLTEFTYKRTMAELESAVSQAEMALERATRKATADVVQAEASLKARELEFNRQTEKLEDYRRNLAATKIYAPSAGTVVYATSGKDSYRGRDEPLAEGSTVRERQELIHLPTTDLFMAKVDVHESSLSKVREGLPVRITVEAIPGKEYYGRVTFIAPMPDAQSQWMNPDLKIYETHIEIEGDTEGLRSGNSCEAEIVAEEYEDAIYIPVQAVVRLSGDTVVYLPNGDTRAVEIGLDNNRMIRVIDGLAEGEEVLLNPPLSDSGSMDDEEYVSPTTKLSPMKEKPAGEAKPAAESEGKRPEGRPERGGEDMRKRYENATPEQREEMQKQWQERMNNMSDEDREKMRERMSQGGGGRGGGGAGRPRGSGGDSSK
jgi:HlyD family secretion protein